ncbi:MAG: ABC transporter ATP-binding protein [Candidatus Delongbacteria bacterium]|nr:ABC transporter ATP-binding protein [Candidatus Delongbacteria bacterium]
MIWQLTDIEQHYHDFTLRIPRLSGESGEIMGFIGPNGAGKTTTIRILMGLLNPCAGRIQVLGEDFPPRSSGIYNRIGYIGEKQGFYYQASCDYNLTFMASVFSDWDRSRMDELIRRLKLPRQKRVSELSKGNLAKLGLVCALSHHPLLLVMDEPTSGLDPLVRQELIQLLLEYHRSDGCHIFFSSHIIEDMEDIATRLVFISDGTVIADFPAGDYLLYSFSPGEIISDILNRVAVFSNRELMILPSDFNRSDLELKGSIRPIGLKELALTILKSIRYD